VNSIAARLRYYGKKPPVHGRVFMFMKIINCRKAAFKLAHDPRVTRIADSSLVLARRVLRQMLQFMQCALWGMTHARAEQLRC
jgi:hypothetical protein